MAKGKLLNHLFSVLPKANIPRSTFDMSHRWLSTFDVGYLVPMYMAEVLPGDTFKLRCNVFLRLQTLVRPVMDNMYVSTFFFFVPARLVWKHWQNFMGEQAFPNDTTEYIIPTFEVTSKVDNLTVYDYFGLPTNVAFSSTNKGSFNALPIRAFWLIFNECFRNENLVEPVPIDFDEGGIFTKEDSRYGNGYTTLPRRMKRHDYFTSCLPEAQNGSPVELPLTGNAPLTVTGHEDLRFITSFHGQVGGTTDGVAPVIVDYGALSGNENVVADLSSVTASTINQLRFAFQYQKLLERDERGGKRYIEQILSHFGVVSPDARMQRPEYLGGTVSRMVINQVVQNNGTDETSPQGNLAAYGVSGSRIHGFTKSFTEHGYIIGIINVNTDLNYQQGSHRAWFRSVRTDFYYPVFACLGEQPVLNREIYMQGTADDEKAFGYQEAWAEYRYHPNQITGKFRSTDPQTLDVWHWAQKFENLPALNEEFIEDSPPVDRTVAVTDEPQIYCSVEFDIKATRPMPVYSVPGLIDHF